MARLCHAVPGRQPCVSPLARPTCATTTNRERRRGFSSRHDSWTTGRSHQLLAGRHTMNTTTKTARFTLLAAMAFVMIAHRAIAQTPNFDAVAWGPLACDGGDPAGDESP